MKEVTYEEWLRNPTPRMMWVWDNDEKDKVQRKVVYMIKGGSCCYPVRVTMNDDTDYEAYKHCAEIEKQRRMTHKELARWLREKPTREWKYKAGISVYCYYGYEEKRVKEEVPDNFLIREDDGDWKEPLVEV